MKLEEAKEMAANVNQNTEHTATVVRILPPRIDHIEDGDNGWDVQVEVA